jgi:hypothetical protein
MVNGKRKIVRQINAIQKKLKDKIKVRKKFKWIQENMLYT